MGKILSACKVLTVHVYSICLELKMHFRSMSAINLSSGGLKDKQKDHGTQHCVCLFHMKADVRQALTPT